MTLPPDLVPPAKRKKGVIASSVTVLPDLLVPTTGLNSPISGTRPTTTMAVGLIGVPAAGPTVVSVRRNGLTILCIIIVLLNIDWLIYFEYKC